MQEAPARQHRWRRGRGSAAVARADRRGVAVPVFRSAQPGRAGRRRRSWRRRGARGAGGARRAVRAGSARDQAARARRRLDARQRPRQPRTPRGACSADPRAATLSPAQAETLAIVAYLQPISRPEITRIRGVSADSASATLLDRSLIEEAGHSQFGAVLYRTTTQFLKLFGLRDLDELPDIARWDPTPEEQAELRERLLRAGEARAGGGP